MKNHKYQVWEGEMEMQTFDEAGTTFLAVIFSAMLGVILFFVLLAKTGFQIIFGTKRKMSASRELYVKVSQKTPTNMVTSH